MSLIAGCDFSSNAVDICLLDEDHDLARHYQRRLDRAPKLSTTGRIRRIPDHMPPRSWWPDHVIAIGIEEPFSRGKGGGYTMQLALGALLACLPAPPFEVILLRADDWRAACELPIRADRARHKLNAKDFAAGHWANRPAVFDDNAADSFCLAYATRALLESRAATAAA